MNLESVSSSSPSASSFSSFLAPAGRVAGPKPNEAEPPAVVSSSAVSVPAATSVPVKEEDAEVKAEELGPEGNSNDDAPSEDADWEPGSWCWLLDDNNKCNSAPVFAVQDEAAVKKEEEEEEELKAEHEDDDVSSAPQVVSSISSSPSSAASRSKKEEENEEKYNTLRRDDEEEKAKKIKSEQVDDVASASQFVAPSFPSGKNEEQNHKLRHDDNIDEEEDDDNNHTRRHSTDRIVKSNMKSDHGCGSISCDNTITNNSIIDTYDPAPFDDNWRKGSWCWERPVTNGGSRSDGIASVATGCTGRRSSKRKTPEQARESKVDDRERNGDTGQHKYSLDNSNTNINHNNKNMAVITDHNSKNTISVTDRQHHDPGGDNWTTGCWCWALPNTKSGIRGVALAAAAAAVTSTRRIKRQKRSKEARESRYSIPRKHHTNIGHHTENNHTDIDEDDDMDDIVEFHGDPHDDDNDGTDSDYDSVDDDNDEDGDERLLDNASRGNGIVVTSVITTNSGGKIRSDNTTIFQKKRWNKMYSRLVKYKKQYKSTCVPYSYPEDPQLGTWVSRQREYRLGKKVIEDRLNRLNSIGFVWNVYEAKWTEMYDRLVKYKKKYKTTCVPFLYPADSQLGRWVSEQRTVTNKSRLAADRIAQLNSIDFVWDPIDAQWMQMYNRLVKYKKQNKTTCVPGLYPADPELGRWVNKQRTYYNTNQPYLTADRITRLDSIGFVWKPHDAKWMQMYNRLVAYKKKYKTTRVPFSYPADLQLGRWVSHQCTSYKTNQPYLTADRITQLDSIGFDWKIKANNV